MQQRYATSPESIPAMDTTALRDHYLVPTVFTPGAVELTYTHHDRIVLGGAMPAGEVLTLTPPPEIRSEDFLDHRELGIINVGSAGHVDAGGQRFEMPKGSCLYLGRGTRNITFSDVGPDAPAQFYLFSAPAHTTLPNTLVQPGGGTTKELGDPLTSNRRTLRQYIHETGVASCQIVMGVTELHPGSMWNTMPAHTHDRRTECYLYYDLPDDARVIHLLGQKNETRHLIVKDRQAVISPSWSIHSGVGTSSYAFIWAMAGENKEFDDMDPVPPTDLR